MAAGQPEGGVVAVRPHEPDADRRTGRLDALPARGGQRPRVIGHNVVGGGRTTHWRVTIDFTKLPVLARTPAEKRQAARLAAGLARALGTTHFPLDVWIDGAGFVRKERYTLALKVGPTSKDRVRLTSVVELRNFGPKKPVAAPPASLVADAPKSGKTV